MQTISIQIVVSINISAADLVQRHSSSRTIAKEQLDLQLTAGDVANLGGLHASGHNQSNVTSDEGRLGNLHVEHSGTQGHVLNGIADLSIIQVVAALSLVVPSAAQLVLTIVIDIGAAANSLQSAVLQLSLLDGVQLGGGVQVLGEVDPVAHSVALVSGQVVDVNGSNLHVDVVSGELDLILADVVDLSHGHGGLDHGIDLAVTVVVHHLEGVAGVVLHLGVQMGSRSGAAVVHVNRDGRSRRSLGIELVVLTGNGDSVGHIVHLGHIAGSTGDNNGAVIGIHTVQDILVLDVVDHLDLLTEEIGVVDGGLHALIADAILGDGSTVEVGSAGIEVVGPGLLGGVVVKAGQIAQLNGAVELLRQQGVGHAVSIAVDISGGVIPGGVTLGDGTVLQVLIPGLSDHGSLDGVVHQLSSVITGDGQVGLQIAQVLVQTSLVGITVDVDVPAGAAEAEDIGIVAHGSQHHLGSLHAGQGAVGVELAAADAADNAHAGGILDVVLSPGVAGVGVAVGAGAAQNRLLATIHNIRHHLAHLGTGQVAIGLEVAGVMTADDIQGVHNLDSFLVFDFIVVVEIGSCCTGGGAETEDGGQSQHQCKNLLQILHF